jgi:TRAP-type C4-dicarboxylate transport system substrate-binding protein
MRLGMAIGRRTFLASAAASLAAPAVGCRAWGAVPHVTFKLHHALSSVSCAHDKFLVPWARKVEAQSDGRIRIEIFPSMQLGGQPSQLFDQARDRVADIVWAMPSKTPGRFPKIETFELPFVPARRALVSSKAIEDFAGENLKDEFREIHPLCFSCADRGIVHADRPLATIADIKGLRVHVETRFAGEAVAALSAYAVPMPSGQLPLAVTRHLVDGCVVPWNMVPALKLDALFKAHTDFGESSLSTRTFVLAMNQAAYNGLPADLKKVIDDNSGQVAAGMAGAMWDLQAAAVADMVSARGDPVVTLMPEAVAHWRKATEPVVAAWLKQMKERKLNGDKLLASAHTLLTKYASEPEPAPPPQSKPAAQPAQPSQPPEAKADVKPLAKMSVQPAAAPAPAASSVPLPPPAPPAPPVPKPAPAAATPPKTLDIPL